MNLCQWCQGPDHSGGCDGKALRERIRQLLLEAQARQKIPGASVIMIQSLISHRNQKPRIDIQLGELHTQMSADAAMDVAKNIIEVCEGAYADAFIYHFLRDELKQPEEIVGQLIQQFRSFREVLAQEFREEQKSL